MNTWPRPVREDKFEKKTVLNARLHSAPLAARRDQCGMGRLCAAQTAAGLRALLLALVLWACVDMETAQVHVPILLFAKNVRCSTTDVL